MICLVVISAINLHLLYLVVLQVCVNKVDSGVTKIIVQAHVSQLR
jgi:hypothetical protein